MLDIYRVKLQNALNDFKINGTVVDQIVGPSVVRYKIELGVGVIISSLTRRGTDIASILGFSETEISISDAPSSARGPACFVDIPNLKRKSVELEDVENSYAFSSLPITGFVVGKDVHGESVVGDLNDMPHMIIGGTTGSGKSVFLNSMITSMITRVHPSRLKLVLIDPKGTEFNNYTGAPHLYSPIITDSYQAVKVLDKAVQYMENRYEFLAKHGFKDYTSFNNAGIMTDEGNFLAPCIIIVDELADLMSASNKAVEQPIARLAQKARASGIHLVLATQRPAKTVVTGLISDNVPSRVAFAVADSTASRIILGGENGAEKLLSKGDMLYKPIGVKKPIRVQGAYINDDEIIRRVDAEIKGYGEPEYNPMFVNAMKQAGTQDGLYSSNLYSQIYAGGVMAKKPYS
jgi:S-DNA-T family DNA segregation ATPase FtsK/SpoIIIE